MFEFLIFINLIHLSNFLNFIFFDAKFIMIIYHFIYFNYKFYYYNFQNSIFY